MLVSCLKAACDWMTPRLGSHPIDHDSAAIALTDNEGRITAAATFTQFTGTSVVASIAIDHASKTFIKAIFHYPFVQLGVRKIIAHVDEDNARSIKMLQKMGFIEEARIHEACPAGDSIIYTMTPEQCRWLENNHGQKE